MFFLLKQGRRKMNANRTRNFFSIFCFGIMFYCLYLIFGDLGWILSLLFFTAIFLIFPSIDELCKNNNQKDRARVFKIADDNCPKCGAMGWFQEFDNFTDKKHPYRCHRFICRSCAYCKVHKTYLPPKNFYSAKN